MFDWFKNISAYVSRLLARGNDRLGPMIRIEPAPFSALRAMTSAPDASSVRTGPGHRTICNKFTGRASRVYQDRSKYSPAECRKRGNR